MTSAARSVSLFGMYLQLLGTTLLVVPNMLLGLFALPPTSEVWIRVVGMLCVLLGTYYRVSAGAESRPFFQATVMLRASVPLFFVTFVLAGWAPSPLVLFGLVDAAGALWTWTSLRRDGAAALG